VLSERHSSLWLALGGLFPAVLGVVFLSLAGADHHWVSWEAVLAYCAFALAGFCFLAAARGWRFPFVKVAGPSLAFISHDVREDYVHHGGPGQRISIARVYVVNNRSGRAAGVEAKSVRADLRFVQEGKRPLVIDAQWEGPPSGRRERDIPANGARCGIDLALKHPGEEVSYAINDENFARGDFGRLDARRLSASEVLVDVTVRGHNTGRDLVGTFRVSHDGSGTGLRIEAL
jgi:hypothetical protein